MQVDRVHKEFKPLSRSNIKKELGPPKKVSIIQTQFFNRGGWNNFGKIALLRTHLLISIRHHAHLG